MVGCKYVLPSWIEDKSDNYSCATGSDHEHGATLANSLIVYVYAYDGIGSLPQ